jgi:hypothetical protein
LVVVIRASRGISLLLGAKPARLEGHIWKMPLNAMALDTPSGVMAWPIDPALLQELKALPPPKDD